MYLVTPDIWCVKCCKWNGDVALNFGSLVFDAGASSITHISSDTRLYKSCSHKALSSLYAWVWKAMQQVKYLTSALFQYGDSSKGECRIRWLDLLQFTVSWLCLSKCTEVYSCQSRVELYRVDFQAGQSIGNFIIWSSDMSDVRGELGDKVQLTNLPWWVFVWLGIKVIG